MRVIASVALTVALAAAEPAAQDAARQNEVNRDLAGVWRCERIEVDNGSRRPFMWVDQLSIDETGTHVTRDVLYQEFEDWDNFREGKVADSVSDRMSGQMSRRLESLGAAGELTGSLSSSPVAGP